MNKLPLSIVRVATLCLPLALVASCGSERGAQNGSTINVSPETKEWGVTLGSCNNTVLEDTYFTIAVRSPAGALLNGVDLLITLDLSPGTFIVPAPTVPVMYLFDDLDGDGFYTNPVTVFPYYSKTGSSGTKILRVQYDLGGCTYAGDLSVISGSAFGTANISVDEGT